MLSRTSRSRSRTVEQTPSSTLVITAKSPSLSPSPASDATSSTIALALDTNKSAAQAEPERTMISTVTKQEAQNAQDGLDALDAERATSKEPLDTLDSRSSSLSELEDAPEDQDGLSDTASTAQNAEEDDSEAETERLDTTPRKSGRSTEVAVRKTNHAAKSPSKLARELGSDVQDEPMGSPSPQAASDTDPSVSSKARNSMLLSSSTLSNNEAKSESGGVHASSKKRKRSSPGTSSLSDLDQEEPAFKRSNNSKGEMAIDTENLEGDNVEPVEGQADEQEDSMSQDEDIDNETENLDDVEDEDATKSAKGTKGKGKQKGKSSGSKSQGDEESIEGEGDEEDSGSIDEELARKRSALDALGSIEKQFLAFREKHLNEQIAFFAQELDMLRQPNSLHPELLAQLRCIDARRDEKIQLEELLLGYKRKALDVKLVAERCQIQSQFFQNIREVREKAIEQCYTHFYALQRDRRRWGADETNHLRPFNPKRSLQIQQQTAYNREVSLLSGIHKYRGFPGAPEIKPLRSSDIEDDLQAMSIPSRPALFNGPGQPSVAYLNASRADRVAEDQFLEQNPWANPQHPAHFQPRNQNAGYNNSGTGFATPAQRHAGELPAPNGSVSTVEAHSNPPSSAAAPPAVNLPDPFLQRDATETPIAAAKRAVSGSRFPGHEPSAIEPSERIQTIHSSVYNPAPFKDPRLAAGTISQGSSRAPSEPVGTSNPAQQSLPPATGGDPFVSAAKSSHLNVSPSMARVEEARVPTNASAIADGVDRPHPPHGNGILSAPVAVGAGSRFER